MTAQTSSRYSLTAAVVDHGSLSIDPYRERLSADFAERGEHLYSDKAPGQPFWAVPAYALHRATGGAPGERMSDEGYRGVWWSVVWSAMVPAALVAAAASHLLRRRFGWAAPVAGFTTVAGTLLLPFASVLFGHVLAAASVAAAGVTALWPTRRPPSRRRLALAGVLAGAAVVVEYAVLWLAVGLTVAIAWKHRGRVLAFGAGAVPMALLLAGYLWVAFGSPLTPSYRYANLGDHSQNLGGIRPPDPDILLQVLIGDRGLLVLTPLVALALVGLFLLYRQRPELRPFCGFALYGFGILFLLQIGWPNPTGGNSAGPRYLVPAIPLLAPGVAATLRRWPQTTTVVAAWSLLTMWLATNVDPTLPPDRTPALLVWTRDLLAGEAAPALLPPALRAVLGATAVGLVWWAARDLEAGAGRTLETA